MKKRYPLLLIFLITILVMIISAYQKPSYQTSIPDIPPIQLDYSWQIYASTSWQLDKAQPDKQTQIFATEANYDNTQKTSRFKQPRIIQTEPDEWLYIESRSGTTAKDKIIHFKRDVLIHAVDTKTQENKTLKTEQITYNSETEMAVSPVLTTLYKPGLTISGVGFEANLTQQDYTFKSDVKTVYTRP